MIAAPPLPACETVPLDAAQVAVAIFEVILLPMHGTFARRNDRPRATLMDGSIAGASVVRAIAVDAFDWRLNLLELTRQGARINDRRIGEQGDNHLLGVSVNADVEFAPPAAVILAVGADFPLAFAEDFQAGGVEDEMFDGLG